GTGELAGQLVQPRACVEGGHPGLHQRRHRPGDPGLDRLPGGLDDGPGVPGRLWAACQRSLRVAADVLGLHASLHTLAEAARWALGAREGWLVAAPPRPARAARLFDLARALQPRPDRPVRAVRLPVP